MHLRTAQITDAPALSRLLTQTWQVAYRGIFPDAFLDHLQEDHWTVGFEKAVSDPSATTLVAEVGGQIVGMIGFGNAREPEWAVAEIYALNVLPHFQGQQIGSSLMNAALQALAGQSLYLKVAVENRHAQTFYYKHGFRNSQQQLRRQIADFAFQEWVFVR